MTEELRKEILSTADNGVITSREITARGYHRSVLTELLDEGTIVKCSRGIYVIADEWEDEFYLFQKRYSQGIYSYGTALYLLGYSERIPLTLHVTFPQRYHSPSLKLENVIVSRVIDDNYSLGITYIDTPANNHVKVYDVERCLCDMVKGSGDDLQITLYAMRKYAESKDRDINKLMRYAKQLRVEQKIRRYMEVLL